MKTKYLLTHPTMGVFLGLCMGLAFWSELDPVGQDAATTFLSEEEAYTFAATWETKFDNLKTVAVIPDLDDCYASIGACVAVGCKPWITETSPVLEVPQ